jgi:hypothetical protein
VPAATGARGHLRIARVLKISRTADSQREWHRSILTQLASLSAAVSPSLFQT